MCDGRPFASSPFRRLASRGPSFRGFLVWRAMQFEIYLARYLTLYDSALLHREGSWFECGQPHDTLSCLFYAALWLGQCKSTVTLEKQPESIGMACCRTLPINSMTCSHVGPMSLEWPAVPPGGFHQSSLSPLREEANDEQLENPHPALPQVRWRRDALQPPEIQQALRNGNTCVRIPDGGLRCVHLEHESAYWIPVFCKLPGKESTTASDDLPRKMTSSASKKLR